MKKAKKQPTKMRNESPAISMHVRKTPTKVEKLRKQEKKYKNPLINY